MKNIFQSVAGIAGGALLERGLWLIYKPAAYIFAGVLVMACAFFSAYDDVRSARARQQ